MGYIIDRNGATHYTNAFTGSANIGTLIEDIKCKDYTMSYRCSMLFYLSKMSIFKEYLHELISTIHQMQIETKDKNTRNSLETMLKDNSPNFAI
jgi:hypothetical protein